LAVNIEQALGIKPKLIAGSGGIFDVAVDKKIVYSKHLTNSFPDEKQLVEELLSTYGKNKDLYLKTLFDHG